MNATVLQPKPTLLLWLLGGALVFYQLKSLDTPVLLASLLITIWGYTVYTQWNPTCAGEAGAKLREADAKLREAGAKLREAGEAGAKLREAGEAGENLPNSYHDKALPLTAVEAQQVPRKGLRYLSQNIHLKTILEDLRFTQMFDKGRYQHLRLLMNQYQKTYMYLLGRRYGIREGVPIFYDLQDAILEILYSLAVNVPVKLRHTYGLNPHERIHHQIEIFLGLTRTMTDILQNFAIIELKEPYFPEWVPRPFPLADALLPEKKHSVA
jgi:hypothetical protein